MEREASPGRVTPYGGAHELDAAANRLEAGYNLPREKLVRLLRGAADSLRLLAARIEEEEQK